MMDEIQSLLRWIFTGEGIVAGFILLGVIGWFVYLIKSGFTGS